MPDFEGKVNITKDRKPVIVLDGDNTQIGIGTTTPKSRLHVAVNGGDAWITSTSTGSTSTGSRSTEASSRTSSRSRVSPDMIGPLPAVYFATMRIGAVTSNRRPEAQIQYQGTFRLVEGIAGAGRDRLRIDPGGKVTIGNIVLDGPAGDILLTNADCAEDFDIEESQHPEPGTVMVISEEGDLRQCCKAYDKKVVGIISGAAGCRPGIVLGRQQSHKKRLPLALTGKVYCKVDAQYSPVEVGDLLTTSSTLGHAMKADDPAKAFGAVIGKALGRLKTGKDMISVLVALQ